MTPGLHQEINFSVDAALDGSKRKFSLQETTVVATTQTSNITGSNGREIDQGTNASIDISTGDPNSIILNEEPNTTFNTQFAQAPLKPFTSTKPAGYRAYSSNAIIGNATKGRKSNIYFRSLDVGQEFDF